MAIIPGFHLKVLWYSGNGGESIFEPDSDILAGDPQEWGTFSKLIEVWREALNGALTVDETTERLSRDLLNKYHVLVISSPKESLSEEEIEYIKEFVSNGGGLIVFGDKGENRHLTSLSEEFGVEFNSDLVIDPNIGHCVSTHYTPELIVNPNPGKRETHPLMIGVNRIAVFESSSLRVFGDYSEEIAWTDIDAYSDRWGDGNFGYDPGEPVGGIPVMAISQYGSGRVFFSGDGDLFRDGNIEIMDHEKLAENLILWISKLIPPVEIETRRIIDLPGEKVYPGDSVKIRVKMRSENEVEDYTHLETILPIGFSIGKGDVVLRDREVLWTGEVPGEFHYELRVNEDALPGVYEIQFLDNEKEEGEAGLLRLEVLPKLGIEFPDVLEVEVGREERVKIEVTNYSRARLNGVELLVRAEGEKSIVSFIQEEDISIDGESRNVIYLKMGASEVIERPKSLKEAILRDVQELKERLLGRRRTLLENVDLLISLSYLDKDGTRRSIQLDGNREARVFLPEKKPDFMLWAMILLILAFMFFISLVIRSMRKRKQKSSSYERQRLPDMSQSLHRA